MERKADDSVKIENNRRFSRRDLLVLLIIAVILAAILIGATMRRNTAESAGTVSVTIDGVLYGTYSLDEDAEIPIIIDGETTNTLVISDGEADVTSANCPDQLCVKQRAIYAQGETIVCLPNRVVVTVEEGEEPELDDIAQ